MKKRPLFGLKRSKRVSLSGRRVYIVLFLLSLVAGIGAYTFLTYVQPPDGTHPSILRAFATYQGNYIGVAVAVSPGSYVGTTSTDVNNPLEWSVPPSTYTVTGTYNGETKSPVVTVLSGSTSAAILNFGSIVVPTSKHTFTWFSCTIDSSIIAFCKAIKVTDVGLVAEYRQSEAQTDYQLFANEGIVMWELFNTWYWDGKPVDYTSQVSYLQAWLAQAPGRHIYIDDCHHLLEARGTAALNALLNAVRSVQTINSKGESNVIVEFYWNGYSNPVSGFDFTDLDVDFYTEPSHSYMNAPSINSASCGGFIWSYVSGWPTGWDGMTATQVQQVQKLYTDAKAMNFSRMTLWTGYYPDWANAPDIRPCELYTHPVWWPTLGLLNTAFLAGN
jgi:hypothetical protein